MPIIAINPHFLKSATTPSLSRVLRGSTEGYWGGQGHLYILSEIPFALKCLWPAPLLIREILPRVRAKTIQSLNNDKNNNNNNSSNNNNNNNDSHNDNDSYNNDNNISSPIRFSPGVRSPTARDLDMTWKATVDWRHAARGARWGLEYLDLLRDIWASELTYQ